LTSNNIFKNRTEEQLRERYEGMSEDLQELEFEQGDEIGQQGRQPGISDPKLWLVRCKQGKERESVCNLYHKFFSAKSESQRIK